MNETIPKSKFWFYVGSKDYVKFEEPKKIFKRILYKFYVYYLDITNFSKIQRYKKDEKINRKIKNLITLCADGDLNFDSMHARPEKTMQPYDEKRQIYEAKVASKGFLLDT